MPSLWYNKKTELARIRYHIHAKLSDQLDMFLFPFDEYFLNIKLKWNKKYRILHFSQESRKVQDFALNQTEFLPVSRWWKMGDDQIQVSLLQSLESEATMLPFWVDHTLDKYVRRHFPLSDDRLVLVQHLCDRL